MGIDRRSTTAKSCGTAIVVEANSATDTTVLVRLDQCDDFRAIFADVRGGDIALSTEGPLPATMTPERYATAWLCAAGVVVIAALLWVFLAGIPRISAFAVAPSAVSGDVIQASYKTSGVGTLQYDVTAPDGSLVMSGQLDERQGAIRVALPKTEGPRSYAIRLNMQGLLGGDAQMRMITAIPFPKPKLVVARAPQTARISNLSATPAIGRAGEPIMIAYDASAADGFVQLVDSAGTLWGKAPYSKSGIAWFRVPPFEKNREMRVVLHVRRNDSVAESAIGVMTLALHNKGTPKPAERGALGSPLLDVRPKLVVGGSPIIISIGQNRDDWVLTLLATKGKQIKARSVGRAERTLRMPTPRVRIRSRYIVVATFVRGVREESVVAPITVLPKEH